MSPETNLRYCQGRYVLDFGCVSATGNLKGYVILHTRRKKVGLSDKPVHQLSVFILKYLQQSEANFPSLTRCANSFNSSKLSIYIHSVSDLQKCNIPIFI